MTRVQRLEVAQRLLDQILGKSALAGLFGQVLEPFVERLSLGRRSVSWAGAASGAGRPWSRRLLRRGEEAEKKGQPDAWVVSARRLREGAATL